MKFKIEKSVFERSGKPQAMFNWPYDQSAWQLIYGMMLLHVCIWKLLHDIHVFESCCNNNSVKFTAVIFFACPLFLRCYCLLVTAAEETRENVPDLCSLGHVASSYNQTQKCMAFPKQTFCKSQAFDTNSTRWTQRLSYADTVSRKWSEGI